MSWINFLTVIFTFTWSSGETNSFAPFPPIYWHRAIKQYNNFISSEKGSINSGVSTQIDA